MVQREREREASSFPSHSTHFEIEIQIISTERRIVHCNNIYVYTIRYIATFLKWYFNILSHSPLSGSVFPLFLSRALDPITCITAKLVSLSVDHRFNQIQVGVQIPDKLFHSLYDWQTPDPARVLTDEELASSVVIRDILNTPSPPLENAKIAFLFLTPGTLPFEKLWHKFFDGHEGRFSIYIHASKDTVIHSSPYFNGREIRSDKVDWGKISTVDAERRLLANALADANNQHFVLLSDSCIPLHDFVYTYDYLLNTNISFVDCFEDPGPQGSGRYSEHMLPEVLKFDFRKGAQWFTLKRQHAVIVIADYLYYSKFRDYCRPGLDGRYCYSDEHYMPTFFYMLDPSGIANWSVTHVDWSEGRWHPRSYTTQDITYELLRNISSIDESVHVTSEEQKEFQVSPCLWNGKQRPCYLFARKFMSETIDSLMLMFSNYTTTSY